MTSKEMLESKIVELNEYLSSLIEKEKLMNSSNSDFYYSSESIEKLSGTQGVTPRNLSSGLMKIATIINGYVEDMRDMPHIEDSPVYKDSSEVATLVSDTRLGLMPSHEVVADSVSTHGILDLLPSSAVSGFLSKIEFSANTSFKEVDSNRDINHEVVLIKMNCRKSTLELYRSGSGSLHVTMGASTISPDDLYFLGIKLKDTIFDSMLYDRNFSYRMDFSYADSSTSSMTHVIANTTIGAGTIDYDLSAGESIIAYDLIGNKTIGVELNTTMGTSTTINIGSGELSPGGKFEGNKLSLIRVNGTSLPIEAYNLSVWEGTSRDLELEDTTYRIEKLPSSSRRTVIFPNLRPIDIVIEEAMREL